MDYMLHKNEFSILVETHTKKISSDIIEQFIAIRKEKGISQEDAANRCAMARTNLSRIENKKNIPTIEMLAKLAEALDMELEIKFVEKPTINQGVSHEHAKNNI